MKKNFLILAIAAFSLLSSCQRKPEFFRDGKAYFTRSRCTEEKTQTVWEWHYGYNYFRGKFDYHYGPEQKTTCLRYVVDTVEIKNYKPSK